jgi:hypothetical protein
MPTVIATVDTRPIAPFLVMIVYEVKKKVTIATLGKKKKKKVKFDYFS